MVNSSAVAQDGKATTIKKTFSRETSVSINIASDPSIIWTLLTNASDYPRWNSTIISIEGDIKENGRINLKSTLDEKRTFKLKIKEFQPDHKMIWGDGKGNRSFILTKNSDGSTDFLMHEKIGGLMFPMYAKFIPPFDESFEAFAVGLKREAEYISKAQNE